MHVALSSSVMFSSVSSSRGSSVWASSSGASSCQRGHWWFGKWRCETVQSWPWCCTVLVPLVLLEWCATPSSEGEFLWSQRQRSGRLCVCVCVPEVGSPEVAGYHGLLVPQNWWASVSVKVRCCLRCLVLLFSCIGVCLTWLFGLPLEDLAEGRRATDP